eukprot:49707_1
MIAFYVVSILLMVNAVEYIWYPVKISDVVSTLGFQVDYAYASDNEGYLTISSHVTSNVHCGGAGNSYLVIILNDTIDGNEATKWEKIRYTQQFWGGSSCWSIFGSSTCCHMPTYGLIPFDSTIDTLYEEQLVYGCWDYRPYKCGDSCINFHGGNLYGWSSYKGLIRAEVRRNMSSEWAAIGTGNGCTVAQLTNYKITNIQVAYEPTITAPTTTEPTITAPTTTEPTTTAPTTTEPTITAPTTTEPTTTAPTTTEPT